MEFQDTTDKKLDNSIKFANKGWYVNNDYVASAYLTGETCLKDIKE